MFSPIKVIDIELSSPLPPLDGLGDYGGLQALVRLHGRPLGYITGPVIAGSCSAPDLKKDRSRTQARVNLGAQSSDHRAIRDGPKLW